MIEPLLQSHLEPIAARHRRLRLARRLALCWVAAAFAGLLLIAAHRLAGLNALVALPVLVVAAGFTALWLRQRNESWQPDYPAIARTIETKHPELHALLVTAVEQRPDPQTSRLNYLQERVVLEAIAESQKHNWLDAVPALRLNLAQAAQTAAFLFLLAVLLGLYQAPQGKGLGKLANKLALRNSVEVTPGDANLERGSGLVVLAKFTGTVPGAVTLVVQPLNQPAQRIPLAKNFNDPVFGYSFPEVSREFTYRVEYGTQVTRDFKVTVFEYPRLERADAEIKFPDYTKLQPKVIRDTRRVSAVEGSKLDMAFHLNKPVKSAMLVGRDKSHVPLAVETNKAAATLKGFEFATSRVYELRLVDIDGRTNKVPAQFFVDVTKNRAPELKFAFPRGDQRVTPLQELGFQGEAWDDFGLVAHGMTYVVAGSEPRQLTFGTNAAPDEKRKFEHVLKFEDLAVEPDELVSYYLWADDVGPDGEVRRTTSDLFFAEVRPFEEIFKPGEAGGGGQQQGQGQGNQAQKLAELQKQIMTATWNVQRNQPAGLKTAPAGKKFINN